MKYIKKFENASDDNCYWLLPTDERFEDSLKKIGCDKEYMKVLLDSDDNVRINEYVFVLKDTSRKGCKWGWDPYAGLLHYDYFEDAGYEFKGLVNISEYEFAMKKYNL